AIDSRNHGLSDQTDQFHYQTMMDDLYAFITAMQLKEVNIIGFSDGSIITMLFAIQYPEMVNHALLLGPNLKPSDFTIACTRYVERLYKNDPNPLYKMMLDEPNIDIEDLQKIQAKTLIIGGENDLYQAGTFEKIHENIQNSKLLILEKHNHSSYIFQNDMLYLNIINFLK
ncbi:alpha/beta fold hydrolase, partial [Wohlfahrtiimonas larvae]